MENQSETQENKLVNALNATKDSWNQTKAFIVRLFKANTDTGMPPSMRQALESVTRNMNYVEQETQRTLRHLHMLQDLIHKSSMISSSLELNAVLERIMDSVIELTGTERAYLMLADEKTQQMRTRIARNWDQETFKEEDALVSRSVITMTLDEGKPVFTTNAELDARFNSAASVMRHNLRAIICIPMILQGKTLGVIYADSKMEQGILFQDISLLTAFASQAAVAINNANLFENVKTNLEQARLQVKELKIQIDQERTQRQVGDITESEYFQRLAEMKEELRKRVKRD